MTPVSAVCRGWLGALAAFGMFIIASAVAPPASAASALANQPQAANTARIWFYRGGSANDGLGVAILRLNGAPIGQSDIDSSFYRDVPAGKYQISIDNPVSDIGQTFNTVLVPGQVAYVKVVTMDNWDTSTGGQRGGGAHTTFYLYMMPPPIGSSEVAQVRYFGN